MRIAVLLLCVLPLACSLGMPDLDERISPEARASDFPSLVPLGPLLSGVDAPLERSAAAARGSLEARAADLRRRAARLRNMPL